MPDGKADVGSAVARRPRRAVAVRIVAVALEVELALDHAGSAARLLVDAVHQERALLGVGDARQQQHAHRCEREDRDQQPGTQGDDHVRGERNA
jgi:hypothetical protein